MVGLKILIFCRHNLPGFQNLEAFYQARQQPGRSGQPRRHNLPGFQNLEAFCQARQRIGTGKAGWGSHGKRCRVLKDRAMRKPLPACGTAGGRQVGAG